MRRARALPGRYIGAAPWTSLMFKENEMKYATMVCLGALASLGFGSAAFAQDWHRDHDRDARTQYERRGDHDARTRYDRRDDRALGNRDARDHERYEERRDQYSYGARGPQWHRGGYIPHEYRNRQYVVHDWRSHRLHAPPRGYEWVQVGGDYVLVQMGNGLIAQLVLSP
jgi:Ni/Co efflux regulator RcnB